MVVFKASLPLDVRLLSQGLASTERAEDRVRFLRRSRRFAHGVPTLEFLIGRQGIKDLSQSGSGAPPLDLKYGNALEWQSAPLRQLPDFTVTLLACLRAKTSPRWLRTGE